MVSFTIGSYYSEVGNTSPSVECNVTGSRWIPALIPDQVGDKHCGNDKGEWDCHSGPRIKYGTCLSRNPGVG